MNGGEDLYENQENLLHMWGGSFRYWGGSTSMVSVTVDYPIFL